MPEPEEHITRAHMLQILETLCTQAGDVARLWKLPEIADHFRAAGRLVAEEQRAESAVEGKN